MHAMKVYRPMHMVRSSHPNSMLRSEAEVWKDMLSR